jgi:hypothetical protein
VALRATAPPPLADLTLTSVRGRIHAVETLPCGVYSFGLHDLSNGTFCEEVYTRQLLNITTRLLATGSKLQYALTTPFMPKRVLGNTVVEDMNKIASKMMTSKGIPLVDLYSTVTSHCGAIYTDCDICRKHPCSYHYNAAGMDAQAAVVAAAFQANLKKVSSVA